MTAGEGRFLDVSRRLLDLLGPDGIGSEYEQQDFAVAGREPQWVLLPSSIEECAAALRVCSESALAVVPAGFGRRLQQGNPPERLDAVLSLSRMNRIVDHAAADMTLVVEAGASLDVVNEALAAAGQWLPFDPPFPKETSIGGLVAAHVSGPGRQSFGTVRESLIGIRAVLADGTVVKSGGRVVKNVAGYDLQKLLVGSFGTLGVIVEAAFKCRPRPETRGVEVFAGKLRTLLDLAGRIAGSNVAPLFLEAFFGGRGPARLAVGLCGAGEEVEWARRRALEIAAELPGVESGVTELRVHDEIESIADPGADAPAIVVRAGLPPRALANWIDVAIDRCVRGGAILRGHAHAGIGVVRLRLDVGGEAAPELIRDLRVPAERLSGYLVLEAAPREWGLDVWGTPAPGFSLMKGVKGAFDPARALSPGRFVGGI
ncbi:MAG: FAD-binding oxidoreductase [Candidatus Binatia bacterium]